MRDMHIQAIDNKIKRIHTYKRIGKMLLWTVIIILTISLFSNLNTILVNQEIIIMQNTDTLDKLNPIDQGIEENRPTAQIEPLGICVSYRHTIVLAKSVAKKIRRNHGDRHTATEGRNDSS